MFVSAVGLGLTRAPAMAAALIPFTHVAGLASSLLVFGQMLVATGYNVAYGAVTDPGAVALAVGVLLPVSAALALAGYVALTSRSREPSAVGVGAKAAVSPRASPPRSARAPRGAARC